MKLSVCFLAFVLCAPLVAVSDSRDTLSFFDRQTVSSFYRDPGIQSQAARLDLPAPACLHAVTLWLGGRGTGTVQVLIYGNEGAFPAPLLEHGLCRPLTVRKTEPGFQKVQVMIPGEVCLDGPQFFIEVSKLSEGIVWLSDREEKQPRCTVNGEMWLYQAIKGEDHQWRVGKYGYAVEVVLDYPEEHSANYLQDVTSELIPSRGGVSAKGRRGGLRSSAEGSRTSLSNATGHATSRGGVSAKGGRGGLRSSAEGSRTSLSNATGHATSRGGVSAKGGRGGLRSDARGSGTSFSSSPQIPSITWTDINNDNYVDLLFNGYLWLNREGKRFEESSDRFGGVLESPIHHAVDIENDGDPDILLLGLPGGKSALLENDGTGYFRQRNLDLPAIQKPVSVSFADADGNGYLDAFIVQGLSDKGQALPSYYLRNTGNQSFVLGSLREQSAPIGASATSMPLNERQLAESGTGIHQAIQWIDYNNDGLPDLSVTAYQFRESRIYVNDGTGNHPLSWRSIVLGDSPGTSNGTDWGDVDSDGDLDLLAPVNLQSAELSNYASIIPALHETNEFGFAANIVQPFPWEGFSGSGLWADVNNDGRLDALNFSACNCRPASLYIQERSGEFTRKSFAWGLYGMPAGNDGQWVDWDNDGRLDLSTFVGGTLRLFRNTYDGDASWVGVDVTEGPSGVITGRVILYTATGEQIRPIVSGRGALMQGPLRVHVGVGESGRVDSLAVEWNGGADRRVVASPALNRIHHPFTEESWRERSGMEIRISATPNPFGDELRLDYRLSDRGIVRISIHSADGEEVAEVLHREEEAGLHSMEWHARGADGSRLPAGTYIYRVTTANGSASGHAVLMR